MNTMANLQSHGTPFTSHERRHSTTGTCNNLLINQEKFGGAERQNHRRVPSDSPVLQGETTNDLYMSTSDDLIDDRGAALL